MTSATEPKKGLEVLRGSLQHIPAGMSRVVLHTGVNLYLSGEPWKHDFLSGQKKKKRQFGAVSKLYWWPWVWLLRTSEEHSPGIWIKKVNAEVKLENPHDVGERREMRDCLG